MPRFALPDVNIWENVDPWEDQPVALAVAEVVLLLVQGELADSRCKVVVKVVVAVFLFGDVGRSAMHQSI